MQEFTKEELENEEWRDVPDYEGYYKVSNLGRVKTLSRKAHRRMIKESLLKCATSSTGYKIVGLSKNGTLKTFFIHKLVSIAFMGHIPDGQKEVVDHINHNKLDNRSSNLRLVTTAENIRHRKQNPNLNYTSKYNYISRHKNNNKWYVRVPVNGGRKSIGGFKTEEEAIEALRKYYEEDVKINTKNK